VHCVELDVVSHGKTIEEAPLNLKEAIELYLESFERDDYPGSESEIILFFRNCLPIILVMMIQ